MWTLPKVQCPKCGESASEPSLCYASSRTSIEKCSGCEVRYYVRYGGRWLTQEERLGILDRKEYPKPNLDRPLERLTDHLKEREEQAALSREEIPIPERPLDPVFSYRNWRK